MFSFLPFSSDKMNRAANVIMTLSGCTEQAWFCRNGMGLGRGQVGMSPSSTTGQYSLR